MLYFWYINLIKTYYSEVSMEKKDIEKEHILTRKQLHDFMMSYNTNNEEKIDGYKLSKAIYELIDDTYNANSTENDFELNIKINMYF